MRGFRYAVRRLIDRYLNRVLKPFSESDWMASALIIAPHPDDETLGCGGMACKKIASGAATRFVFVTDGAASHPHRLAPDILRAKREAEAREAVARLGAAAEHVIFLRYPDGETASHVDAIAADIGRLMGAHEPESIFIPHAKDFTADHAAVNAACRKALAARRRPTKVYEYPIWYWYHWPWVRLSGHLPGLRRAVLRQSWQTGCGLCAPFELNRRAYVGDVLARKRAALAAHATQMQRIGGDPRWSILEDLAGGDFIRRLLSEYETFTCYEVNGQPRLRGPTAPQTTGRTTNAGLLACN